MKTLFFGSDDCPNCVAFKQAIEQSGLTRLSKAGYTFVDAYADDTQAFCDQHDVDEIPHVKVFDGNREIFSRTGAFDPIILWRLYYPDPTERKAAQAAAGLEKRGSESYFDVMEHEGK